LEYLGGAWVRIRDPLGSAVQKGLRGRHREETERFVALRSQDVFEADFGRPGATGAPEKGAIEGGVGRFRRHPLVPVPQVKAIGSLNRSLRAACEIDDPRVLTGRSLCGAAPCSEEQARLRPLPALWDGATEPLPGGEPCPESGAPPS
jgi:hypothetical protein